MRKEYLLDGYSITLEIMATSPQANLRMPLGVASVVFTILFTTRANGERRSHAQEYCENEAFRAACGVNEVIVMRSAQYGRMRLSKCIDRDYGYVGCSVDVLVHADRKCSGRRKCEIRVPDPDFSNDIDCPRDLKPYLEVGYDCVKVETPQRRACSTPQPVSLGPGSGPGSGAGSGAGSGDLGSVLTEETGLGSADCPWTITAPHGQRINLTLHDFGISGSKSDACHAYAIIRERDPARSVTICNGRQRVKAVYTSASHQVEIRILKSQKADRGRHFLLHYAVIGCPDIDPTSSTWVKRVNDRTIQVGCHGSDTSWRLRCDVTRWVGKAGNCSQFAIGEIKSEEWGIVSLPFGLSVIIVVTIALTIGVIFMIIGLACLRWRRKREADTAHMAKKESPYYTGFLSPNQQNNKDSSDRRHANRELPWPPPPPSNQDADPLYTSENEYSYIAEVSLPPPPSVVSTTHAHNGSEYPEPPKYFVLEPNGTEPVVAGQPGAPERYVANMDSHVTNSLSSRRQPSGNAGDPDMFGNRNEYRKNQTAVHKFNEFPFREQRVDERTNNHVSV